MDGTMMTVLFKQSGLFIFIFSSFMLMSGSSSKQLTKQSTSAGDCTPRSTHAPTITAEIEPIDVDEGSDLVAKIDRRSHLSSPIIISSSESDDPTPRAKPAKSKTFPSSLKKISHASVNLSPSIKTTPRPTPRKKGKEPAVDTQKDIFNPPSSIPPLSKALSYCLS